MKKSYIWSVPTRVFHILLALSVITTFVLHEEDYFLSYHVALGTFAGVLLLFRAIWGFMDVSYSRFGDFNFNLKELKEYMFNVFSPKKEYAGHNPAASYVTILIIIFGILSVATGFVVYGTQEGRGVLAFLNASMFRDMEFFEELHEVVANIFMLLIGAHVSGVLLERLVQKKNAVLGSIINGYKNIDVKNVVLTPFQKLFGFVWLFSAIAVLTYTLSVPKNVFLANSNIEVDYKKEHPEFYDECIACHTLYPPFLLPKRSWVVMMDDLENHFGDDASLDEDVKESIKEYLVKNASEHSTKESAFKALKSIKKEDTIAYTDTPFWKKRHKELGEEIFKSKKVKNKANCKACHKNIEKGIIEDEDIKIPENDKE